MRKEDGLDRIMTERYRQIHEEGWDAEHDDEHEAGELASAAGCYAMNAAGDWAPTDKHRMPYGWPFDEICWKPSGEDVAGKIRDLEKAGALIAAEIDRLLRLDLYDHPESLRNQSALEGAGGG